MIRFVRRLRRGNSAALCIPAMFVMLVIALFWRAAFLRGVFFFGDIFRLYYPQRAAWLRALAQGQLPLWTPNLLAGYPLLAEGQSGPFYPVNWILSLLFPADTALNYYILGHYIWAGLTMYGLGRQHGLSRWASVLSGIVYMWSGFCIAHLNHLNILAVASWLPALFSTSRLLCLKVHQGWRAASRAWSGMVVCLAMIWLAGHPQMALLSLLLVLAHAAWQVLLGKTASIPLSRGRYALKVGLALAGALALAAGLAAAQLLPSLELTQLSERAGGLDPDFFASFSLHPAYLLLLISPFFLGNPYPRLSVELVGYVGLLPLLLAFAALLQRRKREVWFYGLCALASLALALGRWNPLYLLLLRVPLFNLFRVPARFLLLFTLAAAALAGWGADALAQPLPTGSRRAWIIFGPLVTSALMTLAWMDAPVSDTPRILERLLWLWRYLPLVLAAGGGGLLFAAWRKRVRLPWLQGACLLLIVADLGAFATVYRQSYNATMPRTQFRAEPRALIFLRADPGLYRIYTHEEIVPDLSVMRESFYPNMALLYDVQATNGFSPLIPKEWARFTRKLSPQKLNLLNVRYFLIPQLLPVDERSEFYDVEDPFAPTLVGRPLTIPPLSVRSLVVESYVSHSANLPDGRVAAEIVLMSADGQIMRLPLRVGLETAEWAYERSDVRAQIRHSRPPVARSWPARSGFPPEDHIGHVYRAEYGLPSPFTVARILIEPVMPRAFVRLERVILVDGQGESHLLSHLLGEGDHTLVYRSEDVAIYRNHDALPRAYLVHCVRIIPDQEAAQAALDKGDFDPRREGILESGLALDEERPADSDKVEIATYQPQRVVIHTNSPQASYLVLSDLFHPGWQATVDGEPAPILRANGVLRAVYLPSGNHTVEFFYRPLSFALGWMISLLSLAVWIVLMALSFRSIRL